MFVFRATIIQVQPVLRNRISVTQLFQLIYLWFVTTMTANERIGQARRFHAGLRLLSQQHSAVGETTKDDKVQAASER